VLSVDEAEQMVLAVAAGDLDVPELAETLRAHLIDAEDDEQSTL